MEPLSQPVLMVTEVGSTYLEVVWVLPEEPKHLPEESKSNAAHIHYIVHFRKYGFQWQEVSFPDASITSYSLTNLYPGMSYQIYVMAVDSSGFSRPSDTATVRTSNKVIYHNSSKNHGKQLVLYAAAIIILVIAIACVYVYSKTLFSDLHGYGVLKWIEENCKETSEGKKRKTEENNAAEKLLQDLRRIMVNGDYSDMTVSVRGEEFRLHRSILGIRNPFFSTRFTNESQKTIPGTLSIEDCYPDQFRTLIHYIYTGTADNLCPENVCGLYDVAVTYQEHQMRAECLQLLTNTLCVDNFCDYTSLALEHEVEELLQKATELFVRKVKEIIRHEKWESFLGKYPAEANKLYMKVLDQYDAK